MSEPEPAAPVAAPEHVLVLRTCKADMSSPAPEAGGFLWPTSGPVSAPDWSPGPSCGRGLHGLLWGEGEGEQLRWEPEARWLVVRVLRSEIVDLHGKVKFPRGEVVCCGDRDTATRYLIANGGLGHAIAGAILQAGDGGTATAGYGGTATAGYRGTATAGDGGTATAGYGGTATAGYRGTATAGYGGTATAGDGGTATAGYGGTATAGDGGTATAGYRGTATAGDGGTVIVRWWDPSVDRYRVAVGEVGPAKGAPGLLKPQAKYRVVDGKLVEKVEAVS